METSLHRELKGLYGVTSASQEVAVAGYRIDAVVGTELIEVQQASLGALRRKVANLLEFHDVRVVKPLAARTYLVRRDRANGPVVSTRYSPRRETLLDLFLDLVHFVPVFPHPRLTLELLLTEQEEHRLPARRRRRRWNCDYRVEDRQLRAVLSSTILRTADDLWGLIPGDVPSPFTTANLAESASVPRWQAQKIAYCLRLAGAAVEVGKQGNARVYEKVIPKRARRTRRRSA